MSSSTVCVDASVVVPLVVGGPRVVRVVELWEQWHEAQCLLVAPTLLLYEVANALHRYVVTGELLPDEAAQALRLANDLGVTLHGDALLHRRALELATELEMPAAYDAHYLALAERLAAELWTADRRLVKKVNPFFSWVRLVE